MPCRTTAELAASDAVREAGLRFDPGRRAARCSILSQEKDDLRDRYGRNTFGQSCLVARRLVERGVPYVTINYRRLGHAQGEFPGHAPATAGHGQRHGGAAPGFVATAACWTAPSSGGAASSAERRRSSGRRLGTAGAAIGEESFPRGRRRRIQGRPRRRRIGCQRRSKSRSGPVYPVDLIGSMYELLGIDAKAKLPHPYGLGYPRHAHARRRREIRRPAEGNHVTNMGTAIKPCSQPQNNAMNTKQEAIPFTFSALPSVRVAHFREIPPRRMADFLTQSRKTLRRKGLSPLGVSASLRLCVKRPFFLSCAIRDSTLCGRGFAGVGPAPAAQQQITPHIGYVFPAGGRQGTTFEVKVGGPVSGQRHQRLCFRRRAFRRPWSNTSGPSPSSRSTICAMQQKQLQDKRTAAQPARNGAPPVAGQARPVFTAEDMKTMQEIREKLTQFQKRMANPVDWRNCHPQDHHRSRRRAGPTRAKTGSAQFGLSQPLVFCVGQLPEFNKPEPRSPTRRWPPTAPAIPTPKGRAARRHRASSCPAWSTARFCPAAWTVTASRPAEDRGWSSPSRPGN